jgi:hypothetical protein
MEEQKQALLTEITNLVEPESDSNTLSVYSNYVGMLSTPDEFIIRFCQKALESGERPKERARVYLSLSHAKRLMLAMVRSIQQYEVVFGEISVEPRLTPEGQEALAQQRAQGDAKT